MNKFTFQKAYGSTPTGREYAVWNVVDTITNYVIDTFNTRRDAKYYCDLWNSEAARNGLSYQPAEYGA
mgnify:CR=1 FL=1